PLAVGYDVRAITADEVESYHRVSTIAFGNAPVELGDPEPSSGFEFDRTRCAFDGGRMVGVSRAITFELTVPGGSVHVSGVADVGVLPTHRRQGLLTAMMSELLDDASIRGEPADLLT